MKRIALILALLTSPSVFAQCAGVTYCTAAGVDNTSIQNALNTVNKDSTTLVIPSGSSTWSGIVTWSSAFSITIQGQSNCSGTGTQTPACTDNTNITASEYQLVLNTVLNKSIRITGITFQLNGSSFNGVIHATGGTTQLRIDHNHFLHMQAVGVIDGPLGVADHNFFDMDTAQSVRNGFRIGNGTWNGKLFGDGSWGDTSQFGSSKFFFFEDNTVFHGFINDCNDGGRFVMRHNYFHDATMQGHEMESRMQGCRAYEAYSNTFFAEAGNQSQSDTSNSMLFRTGTGLIWNNTTNYNNLVSINNDRSSTAHGFSAAASSCTAGGDPSFNCWGYACNSGQTVGTVCNSSTGLPNSPSGFDGNTDIFGYPAFDQVGRGKSDVLPQFDNSTTAFWSAGMPAWPHQQLEPLYLWLNSFSPPFGGPYLGSAIGASLFQQNRDWYTDNASSTGVQEGTSLPATCSPLQAFWNTSTSTLYQCQTTNTWTLFYTPFSYPHPLTQSPGWAYVQDSVITGCTTNVSTCTFNNGTGLIPTTAGTVWVVSVTTTNNVTILATHGWTLCPASKCHLLSSNPARNVDMAYQLAGTGGSSTVTVDLSGNSGTIAGFKFFEVLPPPGFTASFDDANTSSSSSCTSACPGVSTTLTGTDVIYQVAYASNPSPWNAWSSPYLTLPLGDAVSINTVSGTAPTFNTTGTGSVANGIAFTSTAGVFPPPQPTITVVNYTHVEGKTCNTTCTVTIPSTTAGNLLYIESGTLNGAHINSISGGGTWVIPSGTNTCQITLSSSDSLSCGYVLSASGGVTSLSITMSGNSTDAFAVWEVNTIGAPWVLDAQASAQNAANFTPSGVTLNIAGTNDVIFQSIFVPGGTSSVTRYPLPRIPGQGTMFFNNNAASAARPNTVDGTAPIWENQQNNTTAVSGLAFSSGPASSPPPGVNFVPSTINFGNIPVGGTANSQTVTLTNSGLGTLTISSMSLGSPFTFSTSPSSNCGGSLAPSATCTITFGYSPTQPVASNGTFSMVSNSPTSPDTVSLSGTAFPTPAPAVPLFAKAVFQ